MYFGVKFCQSGTCVQEVRYNGRYSHTEKTCRLCDRPICDKHTHISKDKFGYSRELCSECCEPGSFTVDESSDLEDILNLVKKTFSALEDYVNCKKHRDCECSVCAAVSHADSLVYLMTHLSGKAEKWVSEHGFCDQCEQEFTTDELTSVPETDYHVNLCPGCLEKHGCQCIEGQKCAHCRPEQQDPDDINDRLSDSRLSDRDEDVVNCRLQAWKDREVA